MSPARGGRRTRASERSQNPFPQLGPTGVPIPIDTGTVRLDPETDGSVLVEVNGVPSSYQHPDPTHLVFEYMRWIRCAANLSLADRGATAPEIAHLGGGGCTLPRAFAADHPRARQVVVELDARLAELSRAWFDLPRSPALRIRAEDAATALAAWREDRFDVIVRDVFAGDRIPPVLLTAVAARHAARVLKPGGLYLANSAGGPDPSAQLADEVATLSTAFPFVGVVAEPGVLSGKRRGNSIVIGSDAPLPPGLDRALRSDAVSVRLAPAQDLERLRERGHVIPSAPEPTPAG